MCIRESLLLCERFLRARLTRAFCRAKLLVSLFVSRLCHTKVLMESFCGAVAFAA